MSRFNENKEQEQNFAGGRAYVQSAESKLASIVLCSFFKDEYYRSVSGLMQQIDELMKEISNKGFICQLIGFARHEYGLRSISHYMTVALTNHLKETGARLDKEFFYHVVRRPDDITEILGCFMSTNGGSKSMPKSMQRGLAKAFDKFDDYQIAKYKMENKKIKLVDAVRLLHPTPTEKNKDALAKLIKGNLKGADTFEVKLTQAGQRAENEEDKAKLKAEAWKDLILEKKIGYFALLRNLRNIIQQAPDMVPAACDLLTDHEKVKSSLVLPFRYMKALEAVKDVGVRENLKANDLQSVITSIGLAADYSLDNVPTFEGETLVAVDQSGSMDGDPIEKAALFAAILYKKNNADLMVFGTSADYKVLNKGDSLLTLASQINSAEYGGTSFETIFQLAEKKYDRIIILSDMQDWDRNDYLMEAVNSYKKRTSADPLIYSFDLVGYGHITFPAHQIYCLAGFSEKVFDIMKLLEIDQNAMVKKISEYQLNGE